jgi:outer membrane receptor protein involved in Fe transport
VKLFKITAVLTALAFSLSTAFAIEGPDEGNSSKGKIIGVVSDKTNNETLVGLAVTIQGTTIAVPTNIDGRYELRLTPGKYNVVFKYMGYQTKTIADVTVKAGEVTNLNVLMEDNALVTNEVVITASYKQESISALYSLQKNNIAISSGISADLIKRSPDKNTSDVLKRVSGASIQNNQFVVIRGLADRYNAATLNNSPLVSSEPDRKAFAFDIIPSNMVDNIIINKTASPDLPGDFAGGIVQIYTKDIPDKNFLDVQVGTSMNSITTFRDFKGNPHNGNAFLGIADKDRAFDYSITKESIRTMTRNERVAFTEEFNKGVNTSEQTSQAMPNTSIQTTYGMNKQLKNNANIGAVLSLNHNNGVTFTQQIRRNYDASGVYFNYLDDNYTMNTTIGGLANFAYVGKNLKLSSKNLYNKVYNENYVDRTGKRFIEENDIYLKINELSVREMINSQLDAEYSLDNGTKFGAGVNYANLDRQQPDIRQLYYQSDFVDETNPTPVAPQYNDRDSRRVYSKLNEDVKGGSFNILQPFKIGANKQSVKVGGLTQTRERTFDARFFAYQGDFFGVSQTKADSIRQSSFDQVWGTSGLTKNSFLVNDNTNNSDSYLANSKLHAGYISFENKINTRIKFVWGLRVEKFEQNLSALDNFNTEINANNDNLDFLPSLNFTYQLTEKSNARLSASRTVSRPEFRELAPFSFYDYISQIEVQGQPNLKRSINNNVDARYEFYPSATESFTFTGFYKLFENPIEQIVNSSSNPDRQLTSFQNAISANIYGVELEARKKLSSISDNPILSNITVFGNVSYITSGVYINKAEIQAAGDTIIKKTLRGPLQGQSPYLLNAGLQYEHEKSGIMLSLLYNRVGPRIAFIGFQGFNDIYENARDVVDVQIAKRFMNDRAEFKFNIRDLFSQNTVLYQNTQNSDDIKLTEMEYQSGVKNQKNTDLMLRDIRLGTTYSFSFKYNFSLDKK